MASAVPNSTKANLMNGTLDLDTNDIRARLVMTNTTCDTEVDAIAHLSNYTTIDKANSTGYADVVLTESVSADDTANTGKFTASNISFSGLGGDASRAYQGVLIYKYVDGTDANDIPVCYVDFPSTIPATATQVNVTWSANGILNIA